MALPILEDCDCCNKEIVMVDENGLDNEDVLFADFDDRGDWPYCSEKCLQDAADDENYWFRYQAWKSGYKV